MTAANALLAAIHQRLAGDAALTAMIGSDGIFDRLLPRPKLPCIVFGELETRDHSTDGGPGEEHFLTLDIWSEEAGRKQVLEIAALVQGLLHDAALTLQGAVLISLMQTGVRTKREPKSRLYRAGMRFRAVTE